MLARPGMTTAAFEAILTLQTPDAEKRARADTVIDTGGPLDATRATVRALLASLRARLPAPHAARITPAMREIVFDTETTGLSPAGGDRMVEIGCVEVVHGLETGRTHHAYFNPDREMPAEAEAVHGLSSRFLAAQPRFAEGLDDLLAFLEDSPLVAHNAPFDMGFLNMELARVDRPPIAAARVIDTLAIAKQRHPGSKLSLDALCTRYGIDRSHRVKHGALLDAQLLARVYLELNGGRADRPAAMTGEAEAATGAAPEARRRATDGAGAARPSRTRPAAEELARHQAFIGSQMADPIWDRLTV